MDNVYGMKKRYQKGCVLPGLEENVEISNDVRRGFCYNKVE